MLLKIDIRESLLYDGQWKGLGALTSDEEKLLSFLRVPRSRKEIAEFLGLSTTTYAMSTYVQPLIEKGRVRMVDPNNPRSHKQMYVCSKDIAAELLELTFGKGREMETW